MMEKSFTQQVNRNGNKAGMHPNSRKNLRPGWKPGQSGNPGGRKHTKLCLTDLLIEELEQVIDYIIPGMPPNETQLTGAQLTAKALVLAGIKGKLDAISMEFDRVDGRLSLPVSGELNVHHDISFIVGKGYEDGHSKSTQV